MLLLASGAARALDPGLAITQYSLRTWTSETPDVGLPQNSVFSIVQTRDGYLWLATQQGLVRFDGTAFTVFDSSNTEPIRHNDVWRLLEDRDGSLWIGTRGGGLTRYRDGRFENISREQGLSNDSVQALAQSRDGSLWIGTRGGGLDRYKDGTFSGFTMKQGLSSDTVYALHEDRHGRLWIGTDGGGVSMLADGRFTSYTTKQGLSNDTVYAITEDRAGDLWFGTGAGLTRLRDGRFQVFRTADGLSNDNIRTLVEDRHGNLWIGTDGGGLDRMRDGRFDAMTTRQGLSNDNVGALFEDREGSLWIGTDAGGLNRLKDNKFISYTTAEGLAEDNARSVLEDRDGNLWIGTFGGVSRYRDGRFTAYTMKDGLSGNVILSMLQDASGAMWFGTLGAGLNRLKDGRFTTYSRAQGLSNETVLSLHEDTHGTVWAGTRSGGLNRFENGRFTALTTEHGLPSNDVRYITGDGGDGLWIGTLGGGLVHYADSTFTAYNKTHGLSNDLVLSIHRDAEGTLWVGTFGGGLNRFKDGTFTAYTVRHGLLDDAVFQILEDGAGNLWLSSNRGVSRVSKADLDAFAEGRITAIPSTTYGKADGMKSNECNGAHQPAGWKTRDGRLWFPTIKGVVTIDPSRIPLNALPPPVVIERVLVDERVVDHSAPLTMEPATRKLEFRYAGLSFLAPEKVRYRYRLHGFDPDWVDAGSQRAAQYTNIPPGRYRFEVMASNNDGLWSEAGALVAFDLQPRFYQRPVFYLFYATIGAGLLLLGIRFHRSRVRKLEAREQELLTLMRQRQQAEDALKALNQTLEQRANELARSNAELERFAYVASHDLREPLRAVVSFTQLLAKRCDDTLDADARQYIGFVVEAAQSMQLHIDDLLEYSRVGKTESITRTDCEAALARALGNLRTAVAESHAVITHDPLPTVPARPGEITQLFQNLVDNAIKYRSDQPPRIHISVQKSPDQSAWKFCVSDNGIGLDPRFSNKVFGLFQRLHHSDEYPGTGVGLATCKKIVEECGGRIWVESDVGTGSRFIFTLPVSSRSRADSPAITPESAPVQVTAARSGG